MSQFLGDVGVKFEGKEFQHLMEKHDAVFIDKAKLYPDALPFLNLLKFKGIKMGVIIDGTVKRERAIIKKLGLESYQ